MLLSSLPSSWQSFVTAQGSAPDLTLPALIGKILQEDIMRRNLNHKKEEMPSVQAFYANQRGGRGSRNNRGGRSHDGRSSNSCQRNEIQTTTKSIYPSNSAHSSSKNHHHRPCKKGGNNNTRRQDNWDSHSKKE